MKFVSRSGIIALLLCVVPALLSAQEKEIDASSLGLGSNLPVNPKVKIGRLDNGLTYYIMQNTKPENRAELRLVVNAGSILETDDQQGLAHFCEHMAFNGSENFKKNELVKFLESIGMRFGADLNAYTSFDETVYMLELPMDDEEVVDKGMQVLFDWAGKLSFEHEEIDKERGVIMEEWRSRKGAASRMRDKQFPILLHGSKYANRLPIGLPEIIQNFEYETIKRFYRDWYRPDLIAVVAVGDFDVSRMEQKIKEKFSGLPVHPSPPERKSFEVPDHEQLLFAIASDAEATSTSISLYHKFDPRVDRKVIDYRKSMIEELYSRMLNDRYSELLQKANPPFIYASSGMGGFVRTKDVYVLSATVKDGGIDRGFEALLIEAKRVRDHGFTETELERAKTNVLRRMEQSYNERDKTPSSRHAAELTRNYLTEEPIPGIETEYELYKKYLPTITVREVNRLIDEIMPEKNRVVSVSMPAKDGTAVPGEEDLRAIFNRVEQMQLDPYVDEVANKPLVEMPAPTASITGEKQHDDIGVTEWTLSNGIRVLLKSTDFKDDQILFGAVSPGGLGHISDEQVPSGAMAASIVDLGGVGEFDAIQLKKALTGKVVNISPVISGEYEGFSGSVAPKDLETMLQLLYLYFEKPRKDTTAFAAFKSRYIGILENMGNMPERVFSDTISVTMANYHPRSRPVTKEWFEDIDLEVAFDFYRDRFADASDFTFFFVGNFTLDDMRPLVNQYIGSLPVTGRKETWKDTGVRPPKGIIKKEVRKGVDDKTMVALIFTGPFEWTYENRYVISSLEELLTIRLREEIREEKGGTYGVGVNIGVDKYPEQDYTLSISFGTNPERVDELLETLFSVLEEIRTTAPSAEDLNKIKEMQRRERETNMKENGWWLGMLRGAVLNGEPLNEYMRYDALIDSLDADMLKDAAKKYINLENYIQVVLYPEVDASADKSNGSTD
ncbi:MAG: insulinase family protein [Bacteroidetes bacterium]|nr:insulinase family protein [Bacteroidota bacterium]